MLMASDSSLVYDYSLSDSTGHYTLSLTDLSDSLVILSCRGINIQATQVHIIIQKEKSLYQHDFMPVPKSYALDEVVVISERIAIKVKNDTTQYNVSDFRQIDDPRIIDVLEKLPGIQVNRKTGQIKYKGTPVETILLDGDDLFGKQYSIGARTIPANMVDKVEAIEDYHENRLQKGLRRSEKVALNLVLKKDRTKLTGEVSLGLGNEHYLGNASLVNLSSRLKGVGVVQANNIGHNETPFNPETYQIENKREVEHYSIDPLRESSIVQSPFMRGSYINDLEFGTYQNLFKVTDSLTLKNKLSFFGDQFKFSSFSQNQFFLDGQDIQTSDEITNRNRFSFFTWQNELEWEINPDSRFAYYHRGVSRQQIFRQSNILNQSLLIPSRVQQKHRFFQQMLDYSYRPDSSNLLTLSFYHSNDNRDQQATFSNGIALTDFAYGNQMLSEGARSNLSSQLVWLRKLSPLLGIEVITSYTRNGEQIELVSGEDKERMQLIDHMQKVDTELFWQKPQKINLRVSMELGRLARKQTAGDSQIELVQRDWTANFSGKVSIKAGTHSKISSKVTLQQGFPEAYHYFTQPIRVDARTLIRNRIALNLQRSWSSSLTYAFFNILQQAGVTMVASYEEVQNAFLAEQTIAEGISLTTWFQTPVRRKEGRITASGQFLIPRVNQKVQLNYSFRQSRFVNAINGQGIQPILTNAHTVNIDLHSTFDGVFNYKSSAGLTYLTDRQNGLPAIRNTIWTFRLELIGRFSKKTYGKLEHDLLLPDGINLERQAFFVDASFNHVTDKVEYFLIARNLFNFATFRQVNTTAVSRSLYQVDLMDRFLLIGANIRL